VICVGGVQAAVIYVNNEPLQVQDRIAQKDCGSVTGITVFPVSDAADMVSNGIVTNEETIANEPELVTAFVNAYDKALRDTISNPAEAYLLSAKYVDGLPLPDALKAALEAEAAAPHEAARAQAAQYRADLMTTLGAQFDSTTLLQMQVLMASIDLWDADRLGYSDPASWQVTNDVLTRMGLLKSPVDLAAAFTDEFLPAAPDVATPEATAAS
jgi:NitT/TauT family transport system substrate-binding protein